MPTRANTVEIDTTRGGLAVALPSSVMDTQHKPILQTYLAGQLARALAVFRVSEIVVFNEEASWEPDAEFLFSKHKNFASNTAFLCRNLLLTECPQYLKKTLFPIHVDTRDCGALPPLMLASHPLASDVVEYREGVSVSEDEEAQTSNIIECGIDEKVTVAADIPVGMRVTVKMDKVEDPEHPGYPSYPSPPTGKPVAVEEARAKEYWGYTVRTASSLSEAIGVDRYDMVIGTSERGIDGTTPEFRETLTPPNYRPLLVLGGPKGLEYAIQGDPVLAGCRPEDVFHHWVNVLPNQGSKTIRTEEALIMCLSILQGAVTW